MGLDIRLPIGLMFFLIGGLLSCYGLATGGDSELYQRSFGLNVNFAWGIALFIFGAAMLAFSLKERSVRRSEKESAASEASRNRSA